MIKKMKKALSLMIVPVLLFVSCKKEVSKENGGSVGVTVGPKDSLLVKTVEMGGSDSIVINYGYDGSRRLISKDLVQTISSSTYREHIDLIRNNAGIITREVFKSDSLRSQGIDSVQYNINYNSSNGQYVSLTGMASRNGTTINDSIYYTYSGAHVIQSEEFLNVGFGYFGAVKTMYAYDGTGSISDTKMYVVDSSLTYQFTNENTYQYDLKVNPLKLGFESFLINDPTAYSSYNLANALFTDETNPANTFGYAISYVYNTVNKPKTGSKTYLGSPGSVTISYFYQ